MSNNKPSILAVRNLIVERAGAVVLNIHSLEINAGDLLSLIGPNGAGKSSLFLALSFLIKNTGGEIFFHGNR
ncbi:MAG TPA: ATP-binding cassette domain-containing protein, partial [Smithellaceae bacterium]|nr:ATP-binding cassette domain-containing protein [Smithellaceae bacterium]